MMRRTPLSLCAIVLAASCAPNSTAPVQQQSPDQLFWSVTLDHHAITLSVVPPYDTFRVAAVPRSGTGAVLTGVSMPRYVSTDVDRVQVDSTGLLHAIKVGTRVVVLAVDTVGVLVHTDTVWVNVTSTATPPVLAALSIHPVPPDSAKVALSGGPVLDQLTGGGTATLPARAYDPDSNQITGLAVYYSSSDPSVAVIDPLTGRVTPNQVGTVTFIATATAYGITKADTLPFTVGLPLGFVIMPQMQIDAHGDTLLAFPAVSTLAVGGDVAWLNLTAMPLDVTFDDSANVSQDDVLCSMVAGSPYNDVGCGSGNIAPWVGDPSGDEVMSLRFRQFRVAGTYHYHSTRYGTSGTIIVQ